MRADAPRGDALVPVAGHLAAALPDAPRWVAVRAMLRSGHAEVTGGTSVEAGFVVRLVHGAMSAVAVVGRPPSEAIRCASEGTTAMTPILAQTDNAPHVAASLSDRHESNGARSTSNGERRTPWTSEAMIVHELSSTPPAVDRSVAALVRLLEPADPLDHLPPGLRHEMKHARELAPVGSVVIDSRPVSFCYPCWTTERFREVSIDTLDAYRGRGLGAAAVVFMIEHLRHDGLVPVWSALDSNTSSRRLAARLGFEPVDRIVAFSRGPWAFLTAGFTG
jgi:RimJ/RimL family protein N-acetyltransferase